MELFNVINLILSGTKENGRVAFCKTCDMQVIARKIHKGWGHCERCDSRIDVGADTPVWRV